MASQAAKLYVFGGCGASGRLNDLYCFDTKAGAWQQLPTSDTIAPRGGSSLTASPDGRHLYVIAGGCPMWPGRLSCVLWPPPAGLLCQGSCA
jgi:N-acetylneuraminic acid mutarotase